MAELKPCPFCGSSAIALRKMPWTWVGEELWECKCKQCAVRMGLQYSRKKAVEAWNRRAEDVSEA